MFDNLIEDILEESHVKNIVAKQCMHAHVNVFFLNL